MWCFYPRHPRGWRRANHRGSFVTGHVSIHATLAGGDAAAQRTTRVHKAFLSTPPSRVATMGAQYGVNKTEVSIHATLAGGDHHSMADSRNSFCFYPRHPRGWRRFLQDRNASLQCFYPRHPRGWRPVFFRFSKASAIVSIHATLAGGDAALSQDINGSSTVSIHATLAGGDRRCLMP